MCRRRGRGDLSGRRLTKGVLVRPIARPFSVQTTHKKKLAEDGLEATTNRRILSENGHPGVEIDEAAIRRGENPYTKYYLQQGEQPILVNAPVTIRVFFPLPFIFPVSNRTCPLFVVDG